MPLTCSHHGYYKLVKQFYVRPSPFQIMGPHAPARIHPSLYRIIEKVKQVAWMFLYQLVADMGTTL